MVPHRSLAPDPAAARNGIVGACLPAVASERQKESGVPFRVVQIEFLNNGEWVQILGLDERNFPTMMSVFDQVRDFLVTG